ncbi:MAG: hypothetical protein HYY11_09000 [Candidatus Methylomirabilis oxyfera]|nr:hypothetical protein [Candidatus Methylomirabilis oxyfera]
MWATIESALDLLSAFIDFLRVASVSVPALQLVGIILVAFLLGVLLGRITKRRVQRAVEHTDEPEADRVLLDFERLTPLGPSQGKTAENSAMDISDLRTDQMHKSPTDGNQEEQEEPMLLKE